MGHRVLGHAEDIFKGYNKIKGLEGPFIRGGSRIVYYDPRAGQYWDPKTDFYLSNEELAYLDEELIRIFSR